MDICDRLRDVLREGKGAGVEGHGREGVAASIERALGEVSTHDQDLGSEVEEHGVGFPTSDELDGISVDASAEEGSAPSRAHGASTDKLWGDAGCVVNVGGCVPECFGDMSVGNIVPLPFRTFVFVEFS
jgi:hypothetical protein